MSPQRSRTLAALAALAGVAALIPSRAQPQSGPVLVVGDSLEVGTGPHLRRELTSVPVTVDARTGRPSSEGVSVLRKRLRPSHRVVVFDLGTNDDPSRAAAFGRNLAMVRELVGDRCLVLSTLVRPPVNGASVDAMNRTVRELVGAGPRTRLLDWEAAVEADPALLAPDDVHGTPAGYAARARLVAAAIEGCFAAGDAAARPPREAPEPEPRPEPAPRSVTPRRGWPELIGLAPYRLIADYVRGAADIVIVAGQNLGGALGRRPPEVELGTRKSAP